MPAASMRQPARTATDRDVALDRAVGDERVGLALLVGVVLVHVHE